MLSRAARSAHPTRRGAISALAVTLLALTGNALSAEVFTVGPGGTHTAVQDALDAALAAGGDNEVRIARGVFPTSAGVGTLDSGSLAVSGDWNAAFTERGGEAARTVLDGGGTLPVFKVFTVTGDAELSLADLTLRNGRSTASGAGISIGTFGDAHTSLKNLHVLDNISESRGAGVSLSVRDRATAELLDCRIEGNEARGDSSASAGGLQILLLEEATLTARRNLIRGNLAQAEDADEGGVGALVGEEAILSFSDNRIEHNRTETVVTPTTAGGSLLMFIGTDDEPTRARIVARRNTWIGNTSNADVEIQLDLSAIQDGRIDFTDSLVVGEGAAIGVRIFASTGRTRITNCTIVDHERFGIVDLSQSGAPVSVYNTLTMGNDFGVSLAAWTDTGSNLFESDPSFVNPAALNYALAAGSNAIDMGEDSPPGGLGPFDLDGGPRVEGAAVDIGATEWRIAPCAASATALCLVDDRFEVELGWRPGAGVSSAATAVNLTDEAGYFFFNNPNNIEVVVKMRDACSFNNRFWVFAAGLTNVETSLSVTDTETGEVVRYENALGTAFAPVQDTSAFSTCP